MSSYCTAFSYRPLTESFGGEFTDIYLEVPEDVVAFHGPYVNKLVTKILHITKAIIKEMPLTKKLIKSNV